MFRFNLFMRSFNGSRYDCPLILPFVYQYTLQRATKNCRIKVFRRGTVINSGEFDQPTIRLPFHLSDVI